MPSRLVLMPALMALFGSPVASEVACATLSDVMLPSKSATNCDTAEDTGPLVAWPGMMTVAVAR